MLVQHTHSIGCEEIYNDKHILYGQGNFIFDMGENEFVNTSLLVKLNIDGSGIEVSYIPIEKNGSLIKMSNDESIMENFQKRSEEIKKEGFIQNEYSKFAKSNINAYLNISHKMRFITKVLNRLAGRKFFEKTYNKRDCVRILNIIECEAHRELFIEGLKRKLKEK